MPPASQATKHGAPAKPVSATISSAIALQSAANTPTTVSLPALTKILQHFPLLVPIRSPTPPALTLHGYLDPTIPISLSLPYGPTKLLSSTLSTSPNLHTQLSLSQNHSKLQRLLTTCPDPCTFLIEVHSFIQGLQQQKRRKNQDGMGVVDGPVGKAAFYETVLNEIETIGWRRIKYISKDLTHFTINVSAASQDSAENTDLITIEAELNVTFPLSYPQSPLALQSFLPEKFLPRSNENLATLLKRYEDSMQKWILFWKVMKDFDKHCLVLEPENATLADTYRRLVLETNSVDQERLKEGDGRERKRRRRTSYISVIVEVDPRKPCGIPGLRFMGNERETSKMRLLFNEGIPKWDDALVPRVNMQNILNVAFVAKDKDKDERGEGMETENGDVEVGEGECGVCYSWKLEGEIPEVSCEKIECGKSYHRSCLVDWLKALPDSRQSFRTLFGKCPYCDSTISVTSGDVNSARAGP